MTRCGQVSFRSQQLECTSCGRRFAPAARLLGLAPHQRRSEALSELAAALAVEVAYAKASRLLAELAGPTMSARTIRRDVVAMAPERVGPEVTEVPVMVLDGTGERAGPDKLGVALHLAIGLVARRRHGKKVAVEARLLAATLGESWPVLFDLLGEVHPDLIVVDGEQELSILAAERFAGVPVQRCLWHLARGLYKLARYRDHCPVELVDGLVDRAPHPVAARLPQRRRRGRPPRLRHADRTRDEPAPGPPPRTCAPRPARRSPSSHTPAPAASCSATRAAPNSAPEYSNE